MHCQPLQESGDADAAKSLEPSTAQALENHQQKVQVDLDKVAAVVKGSPLSNLKDCWIDGFTDSMQPLEHLMERWKALMLRKRCSVLGLD